MSDRAPLTLTGTAKSAVYVGEAAITGRLIVRDTTTEKE